MRAGAHALSLLSVPLNAHVLEALAEEPRSLMDLHRAAGSPSQTTMRTHLRALAEQGIVERRRQTEFPGAVEFELRKRGQDLLAVAEVLDTWLDHAPERPLKLGSAAAKSILKALAAGWESGIIRALAARPLALTELSRLIVGLSYPSLERRLGAMRLAGQIEPCPGVRRGSPYQVTSWLRQAMAPLAMAARWERSHLPAESTPISQIDVESVFLLTVPAVRIDAELSGVCSLAVESTNSKGEHRLAGVVATVEKGRVTNCTSRLEEGADAWATGSAATWLCAAIDGEACLDLGGETVLVKALVDALHASHSLLLLQPRVPPAR